MNKHAENFLCFDCLRVCLQYEDELLQAIAQSVMPLDRLTSSADSAAALSASMGEQPVRQAEDLLAQELLAWFKHDFFTWVRQVGQAQVQLTSQAALFVIAEAKLMRN